MCAAGQGHVRAFKQLLDAGMPHAVHGTRPRSSIAYTLPGSVGHLTDRHFPWQMRSAL